MSADPGALEPSDRDADIAGLLRRAAEVGGPQINDWFRQALRQAATEVETRGRLRAAALAGSMLTGAQRADLAEAVAYHRGPAEGHAHSRAGADCRCGGGCRLVRAFEALEQAEAERDEFAEALLDTLDCLARGDGARDDEVFRRWRPIYDHLRLARTQAPEPPT